MMNIEQCNANIIMNIYDSDVYCYCIIAIEQITMQCYRYLHYVDYNYAQVNSVIAIYGWKTWNVCINSTNFQRQWTIDHNEVNYQNRIYI